MAEETQKGVLGRLYASIGPDVAKALVGIGSAYALYVLTKPKATPATQAAIDKAKAAGASPQEMTAIAMQDPKMQDYNAKLTAQKVPPEQKVALIGNQVASLIGTVKK